MSNRALNWAFDSGLPSGPRFVLVVLADRGTDHSGEDWTCFPSVADMVDMTGMGRSTVERHLSWLWAEGWITRKARVRPDGTLGINDYTLHRSPEKRAALKAERAGMTVGPGRRPTLDMRDGPTLKSREANPQIEGWNASQPTLDLRAHEPSSNPQSEPTTGAREPGDAGFDEAVTLWPLKGRRRTRWPAARAAWALACQSETPARLRAAIKACAEDPERAKGDFGWPGLDGFLRDEIWRGYLPASALAAAPQEAVRTGFAGPPELRREIVRLYGEDFAVAYVDRSAWHGESGELTAWSTQAFAKLRVAADLIERHGATLAPPATFRGN